MTTQFGSIHHDGKKITLTQDAFADAQVGRNEWFHDREPVYRAHGKDEAGNVYRVTWRVTGDVDGDDASNACDWDSPELVELVESAQ